jgi:hypothetical protein
MCVRVVVTDVLAGLAAWDSDDVTIYVRRGLGWGAVHLAVRAILADLDAPLPDRTGVLRCFCGDAITLPEGLSAGTGRHHDRSHVWQVRRGA